MFLRFQKNQHFVTEIKYISKKGFVHSLPPSLSPPSTISYERTQALFSLAHAGCGAEIANLGGGGARMPRSRVTLVLSNGSISRRLSQLVSGHHHAPSGAACFHGDCVYHQRSCVLVYGRTMRAGPCAHETSEMVSMVRASSVRAT